MSDNPFNFDDETIQEIMWGDPPDGWQVVKKPKITGKSRWSNSYYMVITNGTDYAGITWSQGATEYQDEGPENIQVKQVWPKQVNVTIYTPEKPA